MHVQKTSLNGNINLGLYAYANDEYCLVGVDMQQERIELLEKVLKVPVHKVSIAGTSLLGVFLAGNKNCLLVPKITFDHELQTLKKLGIKYHIIDTKMTALGNNILCNDKGALINPDFNKTEEQEIKDALKVQVKKSKIANLPIVGAVAAFNKKGILLHRDAEDFEIDFVENTLGLKVTLGTVNFGSPYIKSGVIVNSNGFLIGEVSGGPEIQNADHAFGFLDE